MTTTVTFNHDDIPMTTAEDNARYDAIRDEDIDTSDIPEMTAEQFNNATIGRFYRPIKVPVSIRLDADVLAWFKAQGEGYQTRLNDALRAEMMRSLK
jgi:Uncharacterized protein conserved in bacteria